MDWLDLLAVQGTLKSLLQHHSIKASILWHSAFFIVQLSHPYMTTGETIALTRQTFVGKVLSLLLNSPKNQGHVWWEDEGPLYRGSSYCQENHRVFRCRGDAFDRGFWADRDEQYH